ncbi:glyoxalase [Cobetia sp. cqz5-12]|uniref:VOC family protein n=1 Tax=Cobetia sp. cqz5-12 TaxID=2609415 RepID=UPI001907BD83|nr:VOC family protein [Cobetia sp. cqz5-12]QQK64880.1 glyoxalase [Cobetia sp. cqz5-12]
MAVSDPFHLAIQVRDIAEARRFYGEFLGCPEGRSSDSWVDFDLYGHQFVCHLNPALADPASAVAQHRNPVDGHGVPVPHFGVVLEMDAWQTLADRLIAEGVTFEIEPHIRFKGEPGEQATMFFLDPTGNALEFKAFKDRESQLFRK